MNQYLDFLDERTSVRTFDPHDEIADAVIYDMLKHASYAPSSNNFQPWRVVVFKDKQSQKHLKELAFNQQQVLDASAVFLILGDKRSYDIDSLNAFNIQHGIMTAEEAHKRRERIEAYFRLHPEDKDKEGLRLDIGLFAMNLMHVIRTYGYDSVPMRGVDFHSIMKEYSIDSELEPILLLPIGKKAANGHPHLRYDVKDFVIFAD